MGASVVIVREGNTMPGTRRSLVGWEPKVTFRHLVRIMTDADLAAEGFPAPREGDVAPNRWAAGVAQEAVIEMVRDFTLLNSQQDGDLSLPLLEGFQGLP